MSEQDIENEIIVNECHHEDLINIVIHRLNAFQSGELACDYNKNAIMSLEDALYYLKARTADREKRGVEGTNQI